MKKKFDCVKMKRKGSAHVYQLVKDMSPEEELKFWREKTACLRRKGRKGSSAKTRLKLLTSSAKS